MYDQLSQLASILQPLKSIAVVLREAASFDQIASALALAETLHSLEKEVVVYAPTQPSLSTVEAKLLPQPLPIKTEFGRQNLVISFAYTESAVDKVSYAISPDASRFYLTVKPHAGAAPLDPATVEYSYAGTDAEAIIIIGEHELSDLKQLYFGYEDVYNAVPLIIIHTFEPDLGAVKFSVADYSSYAEAVALMLGGMQLNVSASAAGWLYAAMARETKAFTTATATAEAFEVAAELLRRGATRGQVLQQLVEQQFVSHSQTELIDSGEVTQAKPQRKATTSIRKRTSIQSKTPTKT